MISKRQEEGKVFLEKQRSILQPREMIRVIPKDKELFITTIDTPVQVHTYPQASALETSTKYNELYGTLLRPETSVSTATHYSRFKNPQLLVIKENESKEVTLTQEITGKHSESHLLIVVEKNATANIIQHITDIPTGVHDMYLEILVQEGAKLNFTTMQNAPSKTYIRYHRSIHAQSKARVDVHDVLLGSDYHELESHIYLTEKEAEGNQQVTLFGNEQRFLITQQSHHLVGETKSDIATKAVLQNHSQAGFKGLVAIRPGASESEGYQQMDILLLDDTARASAIPELAIQTDIVSCSHGATIGELDEQQLFYLQARGMSKQQATHMLLIGFLSQGITHLSEEQQEDILRQVEQRLTV
jgi:Fe-S cluster assembly protein SufD